MGTRTQCSDLTVVLLGGWTDNIGLREYQPFVAGCYHTQVSLGCQISARKAAFADYESKMT